MTEQIKTAAFVRDVSVQNGAQGRMHLYRVNPPLSDSYEGYGGDYEYVIASSVTAMFSGYETLVFPSNESGDVLSYGELIGLRGAEPAEVFAHAGYAIVEAIVVGESAALKAVES